MTYSWLRYDRFTTMKILNVDANSYNLTLFKITEMLQNIHYELEQCCVQYRMSKRTSNLDEAISNVKHMDAERKIQK